MGIYIANMEKPKSCWDCATHYDFDCTGSRYDDCPLIEIDWIPVSERLPDIGEKVLVSTKFTVFTQVFKGVYGAPILWVWEHNSVKKIYAWMPLPKPYLERRTNEHTE